MDFICAWILWFAAPNRALCEGTTSNTRNASRQARVFWPYFNRRARAKELARRSRNRMSRAKAQSSPRKKGKRKGPQIAQIFAES